MNRTLYNYYLKTKLCNNKYMSYVYLLLSTDNCTYVGATVDLNRRIRQHNKEIKGGAFATGKKVDKGEIWIRVAHIAGFPDWQATLQFEWRWKHHRSRRINHTLRIRMCLGLPIRC